MKMEEKEGYKRIMNKLLLKEKDPKIPERIQSMISKSNTNLLHLTKLIFSSIPKQNYKASKVEQTAINSTNNKSSKRKATNNLSKSKKTKLLNQSSAKHKPSQITSSFALYNTKTRNKAKWPINSPCNKTNPLSNNNNTEMSSFLKTSLNNTSLLCQNNSTTMSKKRLPNVTLFHKTQTKHSSPLDYSLLKTKPQQKTIINVTSPQIFSPYDTEISTPSNLINSNANANTIFNYNKNKSFSPCSFRKKCNEIEKDCTEVQKAVKNMPMKLILDKKKFQTLLNEYSGDSDNDHKKDNDIIEDLPCAEIKKIFTINDLMNVSIKSQRMILESDCITKIDPVLAYKATNTIKDIFSIKSKKNGMSEYEKTKKHFGIKTDQMRVWLRKNIKLNKEYKDNFAKLQLKMKKKE